MCKKRRKDFQQRERMDLKDYKRFELKLKMSDDAMEFAEEKNDFFAFQAGKYLKVDHGFATGRVFRRL